MHKLIAIAVFLLAGLSLQAQYYPGYGFRNGYNRHQNMLNNDTSFTQPKKMQYNLQLGSSVGSNFMGGSYFRSYVAPSVSYMVSDRFSLSGGVSLSTTFINGSYARYGESTVGPPPNITSSRLWVSGQYLINDKLTIGGTLYKQFDAYNNPVTKDYSMDAGPQGAILNLNFRPTENFEINASFEYHEGYDPFYNPSPFHNPGFMSPNPVW